MDALVREAQAASDELQRRLDRQRGYLWLAGSIQEPDKLRALFQAMARDSEEISQESLRLQVLLNDIREQRRQRSERVKQVSMMVILALLALLLIAGMPAVAQDNDMATNTQAAALEATPLPVEATPEPTPPVVVVQPGTPDVTVPMFYIFSAVIFGLLAVIVLVLRPLIVQLGASAPQWALEAGFSAGTTLLKSAEDYAGTTPSTLDDTLVAELKAEILRLRQQIDQQRQLPPTTDPQPGQVG